MTNSGNVHFPAETRADAVDPEHLARQDASETLEPGPTANFRQTLAQQSVVSPSLQFGLVESTAMPEFVRLTSQNPSQIAGRQVATSGCRRFLRFGADDRLLARAPTAGLHTRALPARVNFGIQFEHRRTVSQLEHRQVAELRRTGLGRRSQEPRDVLRRQCLRQPLPAARQ